MRTLSQKRAEYALRFVIEEVSKKIAENNNEKKREEFASFVAGAPASILKNGLGQTLAFWYQKKDSKYALLLDGVRKWLSLKKDDIENNFIKETQNARDFLLELSKLNQMKYQTCQEETLRFLEWVKRYANAEFKK